MRTEKLTRLDISLVLQLRAAPAMAFEAAAKKRGIEPGLLLADLIEVIAADDMFDAILDDQHDD